MTSSGLSKPALERMHRVLSGYVERADMPGLVALIGRGDDVHVETLGTLAIGSRRPMRRDTIFRIASLSKPITAVAAMILVEECEIRLDDAIDPWLPELADRRVLRSLEGDLDDTVPAHRAITVRDLFTSCMGFGSVMAMPGTYPIQRLIREYAIGGDGPMLPTAMPPLDEWLRRLGSLPWLAQPGERWMYNASIDVLGALVARVAGTSLGAFMRERIFQPLGMKDTSFGLAPADAKRLPGFYRFDAERGALVAFDDETKSAWFGDPPSQSGSGGLLSTLDDHFAFSRMMLAKGRYGKRRLLSAASIELMTSDQVSPEQRAGAELFFGSHSSWGFGMAVDIARRDIFHMPGRFGWTGGFGTTAYTDPANETIGILLTQRMMDSPKAPNVFVDFWTLAYAALE